MILSRYGAAYCSHVLKVGYEVATYIQQDVSNHLQTRIDYSPNPQWLLDGPLPYHQMQRGFMLEYQGEVPIFVHTPCGAFRCHYVPFGPCNLPPLFLRKLKVFLIQQETYHPLEGTSVGPFKGITKWKNEYLETPKEHATQNMYLSSQQVADLWKAFCFKNGL